MKLGIPNSHKFHAANHILNGGVDPLKKMSWPSRKKASLDGNLQLHKGTLCLFTISERWKKTMEKNGRRFFMVVTRGRAPAVFGSLLGEKILGNGEKLLLLIGILNQEILGRKFSALFL